MDKSNVKEAYMFPTSKKEVEALGWDYIDVILFTGDAFVDHPSFGTACIARWLQKWGWRVAVVPQPNWRDDLRDFKKLGAPRLYFGVNAGAMDSMVNHYTASKRLRHDDAYTPDGKFGQRPDYAVSVYSKILKQLYPDIPVVIGECELTVNQIDILEVDNAWGHKLENTIFIVVEGEKPQYLRTLAAGEITTQTGHLYQIFLSRKLTSKYYTTTLQQRSEQSYNSLRKLLIPRTALPIL